MFENIMKFFKKMMKKEEKTSNSKNTAKERLHLVLVQDRANVSADFLELMKQEIIEVIKKYIDVDENLIDVHLTNHSNEDGTNGAPALYANIPIKNIKEAARKMDKPKEEKNIEKSNTNIGTDSVSPEKAEKDNEKNVEANITPSEKAEKDNEKKVEANIASSEKLEKDNEKNAGSSIARPEKQETDNEIEQDKTKEEQKEEGTKTEE